MEKHTQQHAPQHRDTHISVYFVWPMLSGVGLAFVAMVSVTGIVGMATKSAAVGLLWGGYTFFGAFGLSTFAVFAYAASQWGPIRETRLRLDAALGGYEGDVVEGDVVESRPRFISVNANGRRKLIPSEMPPPSVPRLADLFKTRTPQTAIEGELALTVDSLGPPATEMWIPEFYDVTTRAYALKTLSRNAFVSEFGDGGRQLHQKYVSGSQDGRTKAIWESWKILGDGARRSKVFAYDLETILKMDGDVWRYALSKNKMLHSPASVLTDSDPSDVSLPDKSSQVQSSAVK